MTRQRRFTKEFEEEAVRLGQTSGRTRREIAGDLGIGRSTLVRWIGRSRDRRAVDPAAAESEVTAGAEAAAAGERDPSAGAGYPEEGRRLFRPGGKSMRFALIDAAKAQFPAPACAACPASAKAAISPGEVGQPAAANATTWCCWRMSGRPLPCRTAPTAVPG